MLGSAAVLIFGVALGVAVTTTKENHTIMSKIRRTLFGTRRRKIASVLSAVVLVGAGSALAAWLISSEGGGGGRVGSLAAPVVSAGSPSTTSVLLPGGTAEAKFSITNPNNVDLTITGVQEDTAGSNATNWTPDPGTSVPAGTVTVPTQTGLSITVPKNATTTVTVPNAFKLSANAPTTIQGATFEKKAKLNFSVGS